MKTENILSGTKFSKIFKTFIKNQSHSFLDSKKVGKLHLIAVYITHLIYMFLYIIKIKLIK